MHNRKIILAACTALVLGGCGGTTNPDAVDASNSGSGGGAPATGGGTTPPAANSVTISGNISFARVPQVERDSGAALDYSNITNQPVRGATVEAVTATGTVLDSGRTDNQGAYALGVPSNTSVRIRVRAETVLAGTPGYSVRVVDNTNNNALYVLAGALSNSGAADSTRNLNAPSGWGGSSYSSARSSGPFAILDSIFSSVLTTLAVDPDAVLPALTVNWSVNNVPVGGDISQGQIGTSFYTNRNLFILGAEDNDTDEFDDHVIVHEWGHFFEDTLSRSDSIGGPHGSGERLDMRLAFGEGFANALSGIVLLDPVYRDTVGQQQASGFNFSVDDNNATNPGWYSEASVQQIVYDLFDSNDEPGIDSVSLGYAPLYQVLLNAQRTTPLFTSIFTFISALKDANANAAASIDTLVSNQNIVSSTIDPAGSTETNNAGSANVLPVYTVLDANAPPVNICVTTEFGTSNKLSNRRFLRLDANTPGSYSFTVTRTSGYQPTDPDLAIFRTGQLLADLNSGDDDTETGAVTLSQGVHTLDLLEFRSLFSDLGTACFDVSVTN